MNKKFLSLVLALVMVLGTFSSVFAAPAEKKETKEAPKKAETVVPKITGKRAKIQWLQDNKYVEGRKVNKDAKNNDLALDKNIQRDEVTKLLVYAIGKEDLANKIAGTFKPYSDVDNKHWANGFITVGSTEKSPKNDLAFLIGYPNGTFKPANNVTYAELAKMLVTLTKTDLTKDMHDQANKDWPRQWMAWAAEMGILEDVDVKNSNDAAVREDAFTMIYNAMYKLKYISKMPATETMGILSQLKNNEITLNQGDKVKTAKITPNTTFVLYDYRTSNDVNANETQYRSGYRVTSVNAIDNPEYYYGSLLRVMINEKGEATHVLELGNPKYMAIGINDWNGDNDRWADVADATVETYYRAGSYSDRGVRGAAAKINYKNGDAKSITFQEGIYGRTPVNETDQERYDNNYVRTDNLGRADKEVNLRLTKDTRYFVADVRSNQLTEVKDVDEAIRILGNVTASNWFFDVYAGYNKFDARPNHETSSPTAIEGYNEATVVVFNAVQKDNNHAELLRVRNEATSKYNITFENTDGDEIMKNVASYRDAYPYNYEDAKLNVVEYTVNAARGIGVELKIEHKETKIYPIVKVVDIQDNALIVEDAYGNKATLYKNDKDSFDLFTKGQLKEGALIQFRTLSGGGVNGNSTESNTVEIVSVMPKEYKDGLKGNLMKVVYGNQWNRDYGKATLSKVNAYGEEYHKLTLDIYNNFFDEDEGTYRELVVLSNTEADALKLWMEANGNSANVRFLRKDNKVDNIPEIHDVEVLENGKWVPVVESKVVKDAEAVQAFKDLVGKLPATATGSTEELAKINEVKAAYGKLTADQKTKVADEVTKVNKFIDDYNTAASATEAHL